MYKIIYIRHFRSYCTIGLCLTMEVNCKRCDNSFHYHQQSYKNQTNIHLYMYFHSSYSNSHSYPHHLQHCMSLHFHMDYLYKVKLKANVGFFSDQTESTILTKGNTHWFSFWHCTLLILYICMGIKYLSCTWFKYSLVVYRLYEKNT